MNENIKELLKNNVFGVTGKLATQRIASFIRNNPNVITEIQKITYFLPINANISERLYCIFKDITTLQKCPGCQKPLQYYTFNRGYFPTCKLRKCKQTIRPKWSCSESRIKIYSKMISLFTNDTKNNNYNIVEKEQILDLVKERGNILLSRDNASSFQFINFKIIKNYSDILHNIIKLTNHIVPIDYEKIVSLANFNWSQRFYILFYDLKEHPKCEVCRNLTKYIDFKRGYQPVCGAQCATIIGSRNRVKNHFNEIIKTIQDQGFNILTKVETFKGLNVDPIKLECTTCHSIFERMLHSGNWKSIYCKGCNGESSVSKGEKAVSKFIKEIIGNELRVIETYKTPAAGFKELDIYIPYLKVAIEYDGIVYHSYGTKNSPIGNNLHEEEKHKLNHLHKTIYCEQNGIDLLHVFSNEWDLQNKCEIWQSIISEKLHRIKHQLDFKDCQIKLIDNQTTINFLQKNQLFSNYKGEVNIGVEYNNEIVFIMVFNRQDDTWEITQICNKVFTKIQNSEQLVLDFFIKAYNPSNITISIDRRLSYNKEFIQNNFSLQKTTEPKFFYIKSGKIFYNREDDIYKIEPANMFAAGYRRIWDCGNYVFTKTYPENIKSKDTTPLIPEISLEETHSAE